MAIVNCENVTVVNSTDGAAQTVTAELVMYDVVRWVSTAGLGAATDNVTITDAAGHVVWASVAGSTSPFEKESRAPIRVKGVTVTFTDTSSGILYLYHDLNR